MQCRIPTKWFAHGGKLSGCASILGSWQICHNVCTSLIAALATLGIVVNGMPLLFLNKFQWPLWIAAVVLFGVLLLIRVGARMRCITTRGMAGNVGLLLAGLPFNGAWVSGARTAGLVIVLGILVWYLKELIVKRMESGWVVDLVEQGRKVVGGLVGVVAVIALLVIASPDATIGVDSAKQFPEIVPAATGGLAMTENKPRMKFTLFDIAQAKALMDKNGDGKCDSCGMPIDQCIESGMMQCTMDPDAKIGLQGSAHLHAQFKVFKDGQPLDLTFYGHRMYGNDDGLTSSFIHVHADDGARKLHMHATGVSLKMWFDSVKLDINSIKAQVTVNGTPNAQGLDYVFKDNDIIEVTY